MLMLAYFPGRESLSKWSLTRNLAIDKNKLQMTRMRDKSGHQTFSENCAKYLRQLSEPKFTTSLNWQGVCCVFICKPPHSYQAFTPSLWGLHLQHGRPNGTYLVSSNRLAAGP